MSLPRVVGWGSATQQDSFPPIQPLSAAGFAKHIVPRVSLYLATSRSECDDRAEPSLHRRHLLREALQVERPTVVAADALAQSLPALAVAIQMAMLELDPGALGRFGDESHLDLARPIEIALEL